MQATVAPTLIPLEAVERVDATRREILPRPAREALELAARAVDRDDGCCA